MGPNGFLEVPPKGKGEKCDPLPQEEAGRGLWQRPYEQVVPDISCAKSCTVSSACQDGEWDEWSDYGPCSVSCGRGGTRQRHRKEKLQVRHGPASYGQLKEICLT